MLPRRNEYAITLNFFHIYPVKHLDCGLPPSLRRNVVHGGVYPMRHLRRAAKRRVGSERKIVLLVFWEVFRAFWYVLWVLG